MKQTLLLLTLCSILLPALYAQEQKPLANSAEIIAAGIKLHDQNKYKEALKEYQQVNANDTNYVWALYEMALSCEADSQFAQGIRYCEEALSMKLDRERCPELLVQYASLVDDMGQQERALHIYDSTIQLYPSYASAYLNKGTTLLRLENNDKAIEVFQQALLIDPYSSSSHYKLGIATLRKGQIVQAYLSLITSLLIVPEGRYSGNIIALLNNISKSKDDVLELVNKRKEEPLDNFKQIEDIILSKIALDKQYKIVIRLDDPISRQMQVMIEKLSFDAGDHNFWMQYYVPFYKSVYQNKKFENLVNYAFSGVNIEAIKDYNKKNKKEQQVFIGDIINYFNIIRSTRELTASKRSMEGPAYYFENGKLLGKGVAKNNGSVLTGTWEFYYEAGNRKATGTFNDKGEKDGAWTYYYFDGQMKGQEKYSNGKQEGKEAFYYRNGMPYSASTYKNGEIDGESINYYREGGIKSIEQYKSGKLNGVKKTFYKSGMPETVQSFTDGKANGHSEYYHENGRLATAGDYTAGEQNGNFKTYYENGVLSAEAQYLNGNLSGVVKRYHENGKLKSTETYNNGKLEGEYVEYYDNGQLFSKYINKKGKTTGEVNYYSRDGKLFSILTFDDDRLRMGRYFDKNGKQISSSEISNGKLDLVAYTPEGFKKSLTTYNKKGFIDGTETYFYASGKIRETSEYKEGESNGLYTSYYPNGKKSSSVNMQAGNKNGYYNSYYIHGSKNEEGWYIDNQAQGEWLSYNEQQALIARSYFLNDQLQGNKTDYWPNGKVESVEAYDQGEWQGCIQYDTIGKEIHRSFLKNGNGKYSKVYVNGKPYSDATYVNGSPDGAYKFYFFDGSLEVIQYFKKGMRDSVYRAYFYGGKPNIEGQYKLGNKDGVWKYYRSSGKLYYTEEFKDGKQVNKTVYYFANGKIDTEIPYENGEKTGIYKKYNDDGQLMYQLRYEDGLAVGYTYLDKAGQLLPEIALPGNTGKVKTYYSNGNVSAVFEYIDGKLIGADNLYFPDGKIRMESTEQYSSTEGGLKKFFANGKPEAEYQYLYDHVNGAYKEYYENGKVREEGNYYNGDYHGPIHYYDETGKRTETRYYYYGQLLNITK